MRLLRLTFAMFSLAILYGCACCPPKIASVFGRLPEGRIEQALKANPLGPKENFKIITLETAEGSSYHVVQVRDKERLHRHNTHSAKVVIWRGNGTLFLDGKPQSIKEGDRLEIIHGHPHAYTNESSNPTVAVVQFTPPFDGKDTEYLE